MKNIRKVLVTISMVLVIISLGRTTSFASIDRFGKDRDHYKRDSVEIITLSEKLDGYRSDDIKEKINLLQRFEILSGSDKGMELDKKLNRAEGAAVYSRMMGYMDKIHAFQSENIGYDTGFTDMPEWVSSDVKYLHSQGQMNGISKDKFGAWDNMTAEQFTSLVLRGLDYDDKKGDFKWNKSLDKALEIGLLSQEEKSKIEKNEDFTREEMAIITYNALFTNVKDTNKKLLQERSKTMLYPQINRVATKQLTNREKIEMDRFTENPSSLIFKDDPQAREKLYEKIVELRMEILELPNMKLDGEYFDFIYEYYQEWTDNYIHSIRPDVAGMRVVFNNGMTLFFKISEDKIYFVSDDFTIKKILSMIFGNVKDYHGMNKSYAEYKELDGNFVLDVYDGEELYLESLDTLNMDRSELSWDLKFSKKNLKKFSRDFYFEKSKIFDK